jgi:DnaJ family protein C protein 17
MLRRIFSKFGVVSEVVVLPGKKSGGGSGLVEMASRQSAVDAVNIERGFAENPLKLRLLEPEAAKNSPASAAATAGGGASVFSGSSVPAAAESFGDYETLVMRQLRQQEERKRLIAEMLKQDEDDRKQ